MDMCYVTPLAAACAFESGHLTLVSGAGEGEAVLLRWHADGGEVRRGLAVGRASRSTTSPTCRGSFCISA